MSETKVFPEDALTLLAPELATRTPQEFYDYVKSLYAERAKRAQTPKPPALKGKITESATKKRNGTYVVTFAGKQVCALTFEKNKHVVSSTTSIEHTDAVREFLIKKKFILDALSVTT